MLNKYLSLSFISASIIGTLMTTSSMAAVPAASQVTQPIYVWKSESEVNKETKAFDNCRVENMYDNGTLLTIAENSHGIKRLVMSFPQQKLQKGQHYDLALQVDRRDVFPVEAVSVSTQMLTIDIPDSVPDQMRKGQLLHVRGPNDEVIYALDGIEGAVSSLHDCVVAQKAAPVPNIQIAKAETKKEIKAVKPAEPVQQEAIKNPAPVKIEEKKEKPPEPKAPAPVAVNPAQVAPVEKVIEYSGSPLLTSPWQGVFAQTNLNPDKLIPMKKTKDQPLDYVWQKDKVFIGVKRKAPLKSNEDPAAVSVDYLRMLKGRCQGNFLAESTSPQIIAAKNTIWQAAEAACSSSTNGDSIAATLFVTTPQGVQIYFFESNDKNGTSAINARDQVQAVVTK